MISLVNPHDVLVYPRNSSNAGYSDEWLEGDIDLPATVDEDLSTKPRAQEAFLRIFNLSGKLRNPTAEAQLPELLRQPHARVGQLPGQRPRGAEVGHHVREVDAPGRHPGHPHRRPRRDGPGARRPAPEELQLLRGVPPGAARLLQPEALHDAPALAARWSRTSTSCPPWRAWSPRPRAPARPGRAWTTRRSCCAARRRRCRTTSSSPTTTSRPARPRAPTCRRRSTSSASAETRWKLAQYYDPARQRAGPSGRCTT